MRSQTLVDGGLRNFRDLGGLRTRNGRRTRPRLLFRSDSLHHLTREGADSIRRTIRPRTLVDLRSAEEIERDGVGPLAEGTRVVHLPLDTGRHTAPWAIRDVPGSLLEVYTWMARSSGSDIAALFRTLAEPGALPAVFFCAAGKDRTGVAAAIILGSLGIEDRDIVLDYARTPTVKADRLPEAHEILKRLGPQFLDADPAVMRGFLAAIRREHGSVRAYAVLRGIKVRDLVDLEQALLTDA